MTRSDLPGLPAVQQVTYNGYPLYRFVFDETPGETEGANLFDPVTSPAGTWYLVDPAAGLPATGRAESIGTVAGQTVLTATMNNDFGVFAGRAVPRVHPEHGQRPVGAPARGCARSPGNRSSPPARPDGRARRRPARSSG